ncbi:MAG TPA: PAS domain-containing protein [Syntrophomonadaceae bacterium]|nr:PAS domain-containing protein [Syntrophomonadaceae bacterium]
MTLDEFAREKRLCGWCHTEINVPSEQLSGFIITEGICVLCASKVSKTADIDIIRTFLDTIDAPILLMQSEPRQVYTANRKACELFGKDLSHMEGFRGGQVFDCIQSFTEAGCGKDINCENCKIKGAIVETFTTGNSFENVESPLDIKRGERIIPYLLQISTEKIGDLELLRIDKYKQAANV